MGLKMLSNRLETSQLKSTRHTGSRFASHLENIPRSRGVGDVIESNDSSQLMSTHHTGSRFARHLENIPRVATKGVEDIVESTRVDLNRTTRHS